MGRQPGAFLRHVGRHGDDGTRAQGRGRPACTSGPGRSARCRRRQMGRTGRGGRRRALRGGQGEPQDRMAGRQRCPRFATVRVNTSGESRHRRLGRSRNRDREVRPRFRRALEQDRPPYAVVAVRAACPRPGRGDPSWSEVAGRDAFGGAAHVENVRRRGRTVRSRPPMTSASFRPPAITSGVRPERKSPTATGPMFRASSKGDGRLWRREAAEAVPERRCRAPRFSPVTRSQCQVAVEIPEDRALDVPFPPCPCGGRQCRPRLPEHGALWRRRACRPNARLKMSGRSVRVQEADGERAWGALGHACTTRPG
jgi:hypothetical protein